MHNKRTLCVKEAGKVCQVRAQYIWPSLLGLVGVREKKILLQQKNSKAKAVHLRHEV